MDKTKQWIVLTAVVVLAVLAAGWFLLVSPKRSEAGGLRSQAEQQQAATGALQNQLAVLKAQAKDLPAQQAKIAAVETKIPTGPALPSLIRALAAAADASNVSFISLVPSAPVAVVAAKTGGSAASTSSTASTTSTTSTTATTPTTTGSAASSAAGSLESIGLTINVVGGYYDVEQYLAALEDLPRALRISNLTVAPGDNPLVKKADGAPAVVNNGSLLAVAITGQVFMAAGRAADAPVTVPGIAVGSATVPAN